MIRTLARWLLALFFIGAGWNHFRDPAIYISMIPPYLPWPETLNSISGAAEIAGGLGILIPQTRHAAGWGLILLLIAIFPANIQMALHGLPQITIAPWILWARLPFQLVFIGWVYWTCLKRPTPSAGMKAKEPPAAK